MSVSPLLVKAVGAILADTASDPSLRAVCSYLPTNPHSKLELMVFGFGFLTVLYVPCSQVSLTLPSLATLGEAVSAYPPHQAQIDGLWLRILWGKPPVFGAVSPRNGKTETVDSDCLTCAMFAGGHDRHGRAGGGSQVHSSDLDMWP